MFVAACVGCGVGSPPPSNYSFAPAGDVLYAIESAGYYGTGRAVHRSRDAGASWQRIHAPVNTADIAGSGESLFAITANAGIWTKATADTRWTDFGSGNGPSEYLYDVIAARDGRVIVTSSQEVTLYEPDGRIGHRFPMPKDLQEADDLHLFVRSSFASDDEQSLIVQGNQFSAFVIDLESLRLTQWTEGLDPIPVGSNGGSPVRRHGDRYLLGHYQRVFIADELHAPWKPLFSAEAEPELTVFCRDLVSHDADRDQWLLADNDGVHLMRHDQRVKTVFEDVANDDHDLILELTPFQGDYYISFARLKVDCIGVRLAGDLSEWEPLRLVE